MAGAGAVQRMPLRAWLRTLWTTMGSRLSRLLLLPTTPCLPLGRWLTRPTLPLGRYNPLSSPLFIGPRFFWPFQSLRMPVGI